MAEMVLHWRCSGGCDESVAVTFEAGEGPRVREAAERILRGAWAKRPHNGKPCMGALVESEPIPLAEWNPPRSAIPG